MKSEHPKRSWPRPSFKFGPLLLTRRTGAALLIALAFLVLLSAVVLALFGSARTDRQNASTFATGQETLQLADAAVNLVQGQIRDATIQPRVGWASQPGMIRTFGTSGNATTAYKLYSDDEMVVSNFGQSQINAETAAMATWNTGATSTSYNALFCDLNSPAAVKRPKPGDDTQTEDALVFPIADPAAIGAVEGFSANASVAGTVLGNATTRRLPMPVKWIYVLRDGQMTAPTGGDSSKVTFSGSVVPSQTNPIVGRIAFWADDDTCKLNINTASEGIYWDAPKTSSWEDWRMAISIPVRGEFQRVMGHPATTSLSSVFSSLLPRPDLPFLLSSGNITFSSYIGTSAGIEYYKKFAQYYNLTPRVNWSTASLSDYFNLSLINDTNDKSSRGGVRRISSTGLKNSDVMATPPVSGTLDSKIWPHADQDLSQKGLPIVMDSDRLYATADELLFKPDRTENHISISAGELSKRNFFLTTQNRAPETTLFGTPRISMWPENFPTSLRNAKDRLLSFCATLGGNSTTSNNTYSFQRQIGSNSLITGPQPADLPASDSGSCYNLPRNRALLEYLQGMMRTSIPGFGGSFNTKWSAGGCDQVIAQSFDFIRANVNASWVNIGGSSGISYRYSTASRPQTDYLKEKVDGNITAGVDSTPGPRGTVVPVEIGGKLGGGKYVTFTQFALLFMATEVENTYSTIELKPATAGNASITWSGNETINGSNDGWRTTNGTVFVTYNPPLPGNASVPDSDKIGTLRDGTRVLINGTRNKPPRTTKIRAILLPQLYDAYASRPNITPAVSMQIEGLNSIKINNIPFSPTSMVVTNFGSYSGDTNALDTMRSNLGAFHNLTMFRWEPPSTSDPYRGLKFPRTTSEQFASETNAGYFKEYHPDAHYGFISQEIPIPADSTTFTFTGVTTAVKLFPWSTRPKSNTQNDLNRLIQEIQVPFAKLDGNYPVPSATVDMTKSVSTSSTSTNSTTGNITVKKNLGESDRSDGILFNTDWSYFSQSSPGYKIKTLNIGSSSSSTTNNSTKTTTEESVDYAEAATSYRWLSPWLRFRHNSTGGQTVERLIRQGDVAASLEISPTALGTKGDFRVLALTKNVPDSYFDRVTFTDGLNRNNLIFSLRTQTGEVNVYGSGAKQYGYIGNGTRNSIQAIGNSTSLLGTNAATDRFSAESAPVVAAGLTGAFITGTTLGDWASGGGADKDGAFFGRHDIADSGFVVGGYVPTPSKNGDLNEGSSDNTWEPNRFVPSAGLFGRFLTTDSSGNLRPWQTLLFTARPAGGSNHPGFISPPDHVYLDFFWMPVVEPYAVSEPLSTAGKVNLNFQLTPFTNITRSTALRGALKPLLIPAVSDNSINTSDPKKNYKYNKFSEGANLLIRNKLSINATISEFESRFNDGEIFRSGSDVASVSLVPSDGSGNPLNPNTFWSTRRVTSDTMREQPYVSLLSRVTTKSNTFTVHYRVQALRQPPRTGRNWDEWDEARDQVVGEYRGSTTIERFLDPNAKIPDYTQVNLSSDYDPIDKFYRWRVLSQKQFAP